MVTVFHLDDDEAMADADTRFWLEIPVEQRAAVTWELSREGYGLAGGADVQPRLPRSDYRPVRR